MLAVQMAENEKQTLILELNTFYSPYRLGILYSIWSFALRPYLVIFVLSCLFVAVPYIQYLVFDVACCLL